tara:strand:+ start:411 stop:626 length:216 start_codon:yes stop_codon:yes gene_type:complete
MLVEEAAVAAEEPRLALMGRVEVLVAIACPRVCAVDRVAGVVGPARCVAEGERACWEEGDGVGSHALILQA